MNPRTIPAISDTRELARILSLDPAELVNRRRAGLAPRAVKIGREWLYLRAHVLAWLVAVSQIHAAGWS